MATTASNPSQLPPPLLPPPPSADPLRASPLAPTLSAAVHTGTPNDIPRDVGGSASALSAGAVAGSPVAPVSTATAPAQPPQGTHPTLIMGSVAPADGRVRNPIPSKLKGKTDGMKGNFNVMHMSLANRGESQARYEAAKRSSESTALQAKLAETPYYVSHHRRANYARPRPAKAPEVPVPVPGPEPEPAASPSIPGPARPLTAPEVKSEQARLLTLLRSLPHATVVDHICKALAFFGGIPDAPAPADGKFPDSLEANGTGNLFVGWVAEIFPDLNRPRRPPGPASPAAAPAAPSRRPRGRPKGSKATKARRDKGLKKGVKPTPGDAVPIPAVAQQRNGHPEVPEDSWVDVDEDVVDVDRDTDAVERRVYDLLRTPPRGTDATPATASISGFPSVNTDSTGPGSTAKKRGRPKGSKNRPKAVETAQPTGPQPGEQPEPTADANATQVPDGVAAPGDPGRLAKGNVKPARPKPPKSRAKAANPPSQAAPTVQQTPVPPSHSSTSYIPPPTLPTPSGPPVINTGQPPGITADSGKTGRTQLPGAPAAGPAEPAGPAVLAGPATVPEGRTAALQVKASAISGAKRKRQSSKAAELMANGDSSGNLSAQPKPAPDVQPPSTGANNQYSPLVVSNSTTAPQAKRPRKSNPTATKRQSAAGTADAATATSLPTGPEPRQEPTPQQQKPGALSYPSTDNSETQHPLATRSEPGPMYNNARPQPRQQAIPPSGPSTSLASAESLAAQYERFAASMQNRQQSTQGSMNSRQPTQHRQQQPAAHSNPSPTPAQVSRTPQMAPALSQQPTRTSANNPNYYAQNQTPSYTVHQGSYQTNPRQQHSMTTNSPGTTLVSHVTHSPRFGAQNNNSPLMGAENTFQASPSMSVHASTSFAPRRTPSASPMDNPYRAAATAAHGVSAQSPHFGPSAQTPTSSHAGVGSFQSFSDPSYLEMQGLGPAAGHGGMGLGNTAATYALGSGNVQRANSASTTASYPGSVMSNGGYDASALGKNGLNTTYRTQNRWS